MMMSVNKNLHENFKNKDWTSEIFPPGSTEVLGCAYSKNISTTVDSIILSLVY